MYFWTCRPYFNYHRCWGFHVRIVEQRYFLVCPEYFFSAAQDKVIPIDKLASVHKKFLTPHIAIIVYAAIGFIFASSGGFRQLAILSSSATLTIYLGVALSVIKLRRDKSFSGAETFKIPGGYTVPVLSVFIILYFLSNLAKKEMITAGITIGILLLVYFYYKFIRHQTTENELSIPLE
ncbi:MAG: amino acid permease [Flavobacteriaceae bacterium]|nr:amino acid permease [Flavobacteriaceae bacterium]